MTAHRTVVILVDDVQRSDEASAAVTALRDAGTRLRLRPLEAEEVETLLRGIFGDVPQTGRLATWMHSASGGNPLHCIELARHLVDRGVVRYVDGVWSIPEEPRFEGLPRQLAEAMEARVAALGARAHAVAEALSVHGGELTLTLCVALAEGATEEEVFASVDELLDLEVLVGTSDRFRFRHDGLREALLRGIDVERRTKLHLRVGQVLSAGGEVTPEREAEVGWHLYHGGERGRGADLLASAGKKLFDAQSFSDAVPPLAAALDVFEQEGRPPAAVLELRHMLVMAGCFSDRLAALKYGKGTLRTLARYSGLAFAGRFRGRAALFALVLAIVVLALRRLVTRPSRRGPSPLGALHLCYTEAAYLGIVYCFTMQFDEARAIATLLEPVHAALPKRIPGAAKLFVQASVAMGLGRVAQVDTILDEALDLLHRDHLTPLSEADRKNAEGGGHYMKAIAGVYRQDPQALDEIAQTEALGLRYFIAAAGIGRLIYRRLRGEEDEALAVEATLDVQFVQAGSMWGPETQIVWQSSLAYGFSRDVLGLRRSIVQLERLIAQGYAMKQHLELARGEYHRERGDLEASREALERALLVLDREEAVIRAAVLAALAETHLAADDVARATERATEAIGLAGHPEVVQTASRFRAERTLALATAAGGDVAGAMSMLDRSLEEAVLTGNPLLCGFLHEARARVALASGDEAAYALHRRATASWFRATRNPSLIARGERLRDPEQVPVATPSSEDVATLAASPAARTLREQLLTRQAVSISVSGDQESWVSAVLSGCRGPEERAARALELLVDASGGTGGFLYLLRGRSLHLVAPRHGDEPPQSVVSELSISKDGPARTSVTERVDLAWKPDEARGEVVWLRAWLVAPGAPNAGAVGAALIYGGEKAHPPDHHVVDRVARELFEAGDAGASGSETRTA